MLHYGHWNFHTYMNSICSQIKKNDFFLLTASVNLIISPGKKKNSRWEWQYFYFLRSILGRICVDAWLWAGNPLRRQVQPSRWLVGLNRPAWEETGSVLGFFLSSKSRECAEKLNLECDKKRERSCENTKRFRKILEEHIEVNNLPGIKNLEASWSAF